MEKKYKPAQKQYPDDNFSRLLQKVRRHFVWIVTIILFVAVVILAISYAKATHDLKNCKKSDQNQTVLDIQNANGNLNEMTIENTELKMNLALCNQSVARLLNTSVNLESWNSNLQNETAEMKRTLTTHEEKYSDLRGNITSLEEEKRALERENEEHKRNLTKCGERVSKLLGNISTLQEEIQSLKQQISDQKALPDCRKDCIIYRYGFWIAIPCLVVIIIIVGFCKAKKACCGERYYQ